MRRRSGWPFSRAIRSILYGGQPSAALDTRSSARSISSNPSRNGLDKDGTRDMVSKPSQATLTGALSAPLKGPPGFGFSQNPEGPAQIWGAAVKASRMTADEGVKVLGRLREVQPTSSPGCAERNPGRAWTDVSPISLSLHPGYRA